MRCGFVVWPALALLFCRLGLAAKINAVSSDELGSIVRIGGSPYFFPTDAAQTSKPSTDISVSNGLHLVTSIRVRESVITQDFLESRIRAYSNADDVWNDNFLESVVITCNAASECSFDETSANWFDENEVKYLFLAGDFQEPKFKNTKVTSVGTGLPSGPYLFDIPDKRSPSEPLSFHKAYRLFRDDYQSFLFGVLPKPDGNGWVQTHFTLPSDPEGAQYIPVSSRLSVQPSEQPLLGMRFALKDLFDAQGVPTGAGSLAYAKVNPIPETTAPSIQRLLDLGATLVGKTRTSQFAHGAHPWEFIDIPYSWNPRADGHLTASASSSGSATAIAGYQWLDFTVGSDTRGSIRKPASLVGAYGIRPSLGSLDLTGVVPLSDEMDTTGFFARDPFIFYEVAQHWFADSPAWSKDAVTKFPAIMYYPTEHFPMKNPKAQRLLHEFVQTLRSQLNITAVTMDFTEVLTTHFPNRSFSKFQINSNKLAEYHSYHSVGKPLIKRYTEEFGEEPTFDPVPKAMFERAKHITPEEYQEALKMKKTFTSSIAESLFQPHSESCSDSLFIYDAGTGGRPSYRSQELNELDGSVPFLLTRPLDDQQDASPRPADFFNFLASMGNLPEITIPIGQVKYFSHVSSEYEMIPVAVQLVARSGCDMVLLEIVKKLGELGVLRDVQVGRTAF
ncbi:amidase signature enzyme [Pluteus cervinus]|uniref:Amidase signature enzyme n=1 Tax=Pluteus cervinus TaxID=181527 RepID=A0ACD3AAS7_9AGAR|nr:amidase signature enzyme [Pluteus cervinus]